jgi:hypothetical protein
MYFRLMHNIEVNSFINTYICISYGPKTATYLALARIFGYGDFAHKSGNFGQLQKESDSCAQDTSSHKSA